MRKSEKEGNRRAESAIKRKLAQTPCPSSLASSSIVCLSLPVLVLLLIPVQTPSSSLLTTYSLLNFVSLSYIHILINSTYLLASSTIYNNNNDSGARQLHSKGDTTRFCTALPSNSHLSLLSAPLAHPPQCIITSIILERLKPGGRSVQVASSCCVC